MAKFSEQSEAEKIILLKDEFIKCVEELLIDPTEIQKSITEEQFKKAVEFLPNIKVADCNCGTCIQMDKFDTRVPVELECLISVARKRCEETIV